MAELSSRENHQKFWECVKHLSIGVLLLIELFPLYMMIQISFKTNSMFVQNPWKFSAIQDWQWSNWLFGVKLVAPYLANTLFVAVGATVGALVLALMGAYFFARYKMPFSGAVWSCFLILMMLPSVINIVPLYSLIKSMHLLNTLWALIILGIAGGQVFNIYVLRNFIEEIPKDLFEAAEMDGASHLNQLRNIVIPLSGPIIGTLAILTFLGQWNDFLMPLILLRDKELFTLGVGLIYLDGEYVKEWGKIMATFFIASLPLIVLFVFTLKLFVRGLSAGAVKG